MCNPPFCDASDQMTSSKPVLVLSGGRGSSLYPPSPSFLPSFLKYPLIRDSACVIQPMVRRKKEEIKDMCQCEEGTCASRMCLSYAETEVAVDLGLMLPPDAFRSSRTRMCALRATPESQRPGTAAGEWQRGTRGWEFTEPRANFTSSVNTRSNGHPPCCDCPESRFACPGLHSCARRDQGTRGKLANQPLGAESLRQQVITARSSRSRAKGLSELFMSVFESQNHLTWTCKPRNSKTSS